MLTKYNPLRNLVSFENPLFIDWQDHLPNTGTGTWADRGRVEPFAIRTKETDKEHLIRIEAAGFEKNEISIEVTDQIMSIRGEKEEEEEGEWDLNTALSRTFSLPENILIDSISAELKNGILLITIPKKDKIKKRILINE